MERMDSVMPLLDSPDVELVVYWHDGRWVDANGNEVDKKTANRARKQMKKHLENPIAPAAVPPPEEPDDDEEDEGSEEVDYSTLTKADLVAEVQRRNEGRAEEDLLNEDGTKAELIAELEEDDEAE
jgi:hypothetical protein